MVPILGTVLKVVGEHAITSSLKSLLRDRREAEKKQEECPVVNGVKNLLIGATLAVPLAQSYRKLGEMEYRSYKSAA